jgi:hypothetical protein
MYNFCEAGIFLVYLMLLLTVFGQISGSRRSRLFFLITRKSSKGRKNKLKGRTLAMSGVDVPGDGKNINLPENTKNYYPYPKSEKYTIFSRPRVGKSP